MIRVAEEKDSAHDTGLVAERTITKTTTQRANPYAAKCQPNLEVFRRE